MNYDTRVSDAELQTMIFEDAACMHLWDFRILQDMAEELLDSRVNSTIKTYEPEDPHDRMMYLGNKYLEAKKAYDEALEVVISQLRKS